MASDDLRRPVIDELLYIHVYVSMSGQNVCMYTCVCALQLFAAAYKDLHTK